MRLFRLACRVPDQDEDFLTAFLSDHVFWGWEVQQACVDQKEFIIYHDSDDAMRTLLAAVTMQWPQAECTLSSIEVQDWSESWKVFFEPIRVEDTFIVLPSWHRDKKDLRGLIPLYIEPKMAFGTGHHATTALCLKAVARLHAEQAIHRETEFLDLGTGSGILALACAKLGLSGMGVDIDPVAVDNARENLLLNKVQDQVEIRHGGLDILKRGQRFGLILANILAGPLVRMAPDLVASLTPNGCLILSGILDDQVGRVKTAFQEQGLPAPTSLIRAEWTALVWTSQLETAPL